MLTQTDDETQQFRGLSSEDDVTDGTPVVSYRFQWTENTIRSTQLKGEHYFNLGPFDQMSINWRAADGAATRKAPDTRTYTYAVNAQGLEEAVTPSRQAAGDLREVFQAPDRVYAELRDEINEYGIDAELPFYLGDVETSVILGASSYERVRASADRFFRFDITSLAPSHIALMTPYQLFSLENWGKGYLDVRDFSAGAANAAGIFPFADSRRRDHVGLRGGGCATHPENPSGRRCPPRRDDFVRGRLRRQHLGRHQQCREPGLRGHLAGGLDHLRVRQRHAGTDRVLQHVEPAEPA